MNPREGLLNMKVSGTTKNLCLVLSHMRKQQGIPQKEVAKALGTTQGLISRYENGNSLPDLDLLSRWLDYFEIEAENKHELLEEYSRKVEMEAKTDSQKNLDLSRFQNSMLLLPLDLVSLWDSRRFLSITTSQASSYQSLITSTLES